MESEIKGDEMRKQVLKILMAFVGFAALSGVAKAEIRQEIIVTLPFAFVADGQTLPAGTYTLSRFSDEKRDGLILSSREHHVSVFVRPLVVESARADKSSVSFQRVGESLFLAKIETKRDVYTIPVSRMEIMEATKSPNGTPSSASSGGN
jgi:hypothetical protein